MTGAWINRSCLLVLLGTAVVLASFAKGFCGQPAPGKVIELRQEDREALASLGSDVVGKALPAVPISNTTDLMPLRSGKWTYRVLAGERKGSYEEDIITRARHDQIGKSWHRVAGTQFIEYFLVGGQGQINLISEVDLHEDVITRYQPMFPVMYNGMRPGESNEVESEVRVYDLYEPSFEKYKGHLRIIHTYVGAYRVTVPAGTYPAILIRSLYDGKVGPATFKDVGYVFYAQGVGIVASVERMHVTAFLFYDKWTQASKVLVHKGD